MKRKELLQRDDDDGDSMLSSATSDTSSTKRKRFVLCHMFHAQFFFCLSEFDFFSILFSATRKTQRKTE